MLPPNIRDIVSRKIKGRGKYSEEIRSFALTLHFYSPKAYNYVRRTWTKLLPHPSTIRGWYGVVDGKPGFTSEALEAISLRTASSKNIICNLVLDEMSIREQIIYDKKQFYGGVDFGTVIEKQDNDNITTAKNALVFMVVALNDSWKIPIGYFIIRSLNGTERANLLRRALELLHNVGVNVFSLTFDGAPCNLSMCTNLGADFTYGPTFKPWFQNPVNNENIFIFFDLCHMIKLVRNTLGDKKILKNEFREDIKWDYIEALHEYQMKEGLKAANKLTRKHLDYTNNKMNVKLAMQTLSESVFNSLRMLRSIEDKDINERFSSSTATGTFCLQMNNITDMLNCRNVYAKGLFKGPLNANTFINLKDAATAFESYIVNLSDENGVPILQTGRKTGFLGLIIDMRNIFPLFEKNNSLGQSYLLTFKLSQDHLETFFSAIRSRGGFNNNPNVIQFTSAYKRLIVRHEVKELENGNCQFDNINILHTSSKRAATNSVTENKEQVEEATMNVFCKEHDYVRTNWELTPFVDEVVKYIAGYVAQKVINTVDCNICKEHLQGSEILSLLTQLKNRGPFIAPSEDVINICKGAELSIRKLKGANSNFTPGRATFKSDLNSEIFKLIDVPFKTDIMDVHTMDSGHRTQLLDSIINVYINTRMFHEAKMASSHDKNLRHKYTKLILFKNQ